MTHCDIADRVSDVMRVMESVYRDRKPDLGATQVKPTEVAVGIEDFDETLGNLLDNACRFAHKRVRVGAVLDDASCIITIEDDGPGMAARRSPRDRPWRAPSRSKPGAGLGLGIVHDLARAYKGELRLDRSGLGGLAAILVLPLAPTAIDSASEDLPNVPRCS
jgi:signal transduction histidine kinase